jgi:uncharacterized membrane protein YdjX (TVP38/TMEM64 family)
MTRNLLRAGLLAFVAAIVLWSIANRDVFSAASVDDWLTGLGSLAPLAFIALYTLGTLGLVPGSLFTLAGGALFGPVWGTAFSIVGATLGASLAFLIARYAAGDWIRRMGGSKFEQLLSKTEAEDWRFVAFVRLVPLFPFSFTNYALGITRIGFLSYVVTSFVCMLPGAIAFSWLGYAGRSALEGDRAAIHYGLLALGLLAVIVFAPRFLRRFRE